MIFGLHSFSPRVDAFSNDRCKTFIVYIAYYETNCINKQTQRRICDFLLFLTSLDILLLCYFVFVIQEGKVLIVIGGDDQYRDADEEERAVISRWARRKVASQFKEECLDGRESFIFSWNKQHREIHEEALLHYFDPRKKGQQFAFQPKPKPKLAPMPKSEEPKIAFPEAKDIQREVELYKAIFLLVISILARTSVFLSIFSFIFLKLIHFTDRARLQYTPTYK